MLRRALNIHKRYRAWADDKPWLVLIPLYSLLVIALVIGYATDSINAYPSDESLFDLFK